jgi:hypothetical protein
VIGKFQTNIYTNNFEAGVGLRSPDSWDCEFESRRGHGYLSLVFAVCCARRGFCDLPILRPGESYRMCVLVCNQMQQ